MSTEYGHIKPLSNSPFTLEFQVSHRTYIPLSVRSHLRTKTHQKNAIELSKQKVLKESADQTSNNFKTSQTPKSPLR